MSGAPVVDRRDISVRQREQRSLNVTCPYLDGKRTIYITCTPGSRLHKFDISQGLDKDIVFGGVGTMCEHGGGGGANVELGAANVGHHVGTTITLSSDGFTVQEKNQCVQQ